MNIFLTANRLQSGFVIMIAFSLMFLSFNLHADEPQDAPNFSLMSKVADSKDGKAQSADSKPGEMVSLTDHAGQVVLVNFWASWCEPCRTEMPILDAIYEEYKGLGLTVLGVNAEADSTSAFKFLDKTSVGFPILLDPEDKVTQLYEVDAMPTTVIIGRNGKIRSRHRGYREGYKALYEQEIKALLKEKSAKDTKQSKQ